MRRICFDIASSYYNPPLVWFEGPNEARRHFKDTKFRFWAASTFDDLEERFASFTNYNELLAKLVEADEMVSFNGRKSDLVVLENLAGEEAARALWGKKHHDLTGWCGHWKLIDAIGRLLPELVPQFESVRTERRAELGDSCADTYIAGDIAGTYRDVRFTYALFSKYLESGDTDRTFFDLQTLMPRRLL
jgi:hypothetical protein